MKKNQLLTFVILCLPVFLFAQKSVENSPVKIGNKTFKTYQIQSRTDKFILYKVSKGIKQPLFFLTRKISFENRNNREVLVVEQYYDSTNGRNTDTSVLIRKSLIPLSYTAKLSNQTESFEFTQTKVVGKIKMNNGKSEDFETVLSEPVFNAVTLDELIQTSPIEKKPTISFRLYNPGKQFFTNTLKVIGSEKIKTIEGKSLDTWVINLEGSAIPTKMWVTKGNQKLIQQKSDFPNGDEFWKVRLYG